MITHEAPLSAAEVMFPVKVKPDCLNMYFDELLQEGLQFDKWFFGHYHRDQQYQDKFICLNEQIVRVV